MNDRTGALRPEDYEEPSCLLCGVPEWIAEEWRTSYGEETAFRLIEMTAIPPSLSLRLSPDAPRDLCERFEGAGVSTAESPLPEGLRINGVPLPSTLPGYAEGWFSPQSESSIAAGCEAADFEGTHFLDMCAGRGVKTGQIAQLRPDATIEAWAKQKKVNLNKVEQYSDTIEQDYVISQSIASGKTIKEGDTITVDMQDGKLAIR